MEFGEMEPNVQVEREGGEITLGGGEERLALV